MAKYHKYVFNTDEREFVGEFEKMYQKEQAEGFDSWHQENSMQLNRKFALAILDMWNFSLIVDVGCGKGALTHLLKKNNNKVFGTDISSTAIKRAEARYPDIDFFELKVGNCFWKKHKSLVYLLLQRAEINILAQ